MKRRATSIALAVLMTLPLLAGETGHLVIIGGGKRPMAMMREIVTLGGGADSRFLVIPMASSAPLDVALYQQYQLDKAGAGSVDFAIFSPESADHDTTLARLDGVTGIFFSGGDQRRLAAHLAGTRFLERLHELYRDGAVIAGTSAGAAVMSRVMITGDEVGLAEDAEPFQRIAAETVVTDTGFAFIEGAIIDQHFIRRKRHNRLISLVLERPELLGIGIDEATAIVVAPDGTFRVSGENTVLVIDAADAADIGTDARGNLGAAGMTMHLLREGDRFDMRKRAVVEP